MNKSSTLVIAGLVWLGTLAGAYILGKNSSGTPPSSSPGLQVAGPAIAGSPSGTHSTGGGIGNTGGAQSSQSPGAASGDPAAIIRKAKILLSGGMMNMNAMIEVGALLKSIPYDKIPETLALVEDIRNPQAKQGLYMMLLSRWAEKDGPAALEFADELAKKSGGGMMVGGGAKMMVLQTWSQNDPDAVWDWYLDEEKNEESSAGMFGGNNMALMGVFSGLVGKNPTLAFERLATVENQQAKQMALSGMMQHITDPEVQNALAAYLDTLPDKERTTAMSGFIGQWAMMDPDSMMEFAAERPPEEKRTLLKSAGQTMLWADPDRGIEMLLENSTEEERPNAYSMIVNTLAGRSQKEAEAFLSEQPQGPELDQARSSLSRTLVQSNPEKAMQWATEITDESIRESTVGTAYLEWAKKDEAAANEALPESGLSPEAVQRLLETVDSQNAGESTDAAPTPFVVPAGTTTID